MQVTVSYVSTGKLEVVTKLGFIFALLAALSPTFAQSGEVDVALGFSGEIVANTWNPLRISLRDQGAAEFVLELDQGNLRDGEQLVRYRAPLTGGSGLYVFEDDLYLPAWRRLTWAVRTQGSVLASGSVDRRRVDPRPLHLVGADATPPDLEREARVVDVRADMLPERPSAYAGVASLMIRGDAPAGTVAAAAAAGTTVHLNEPLAEELRRLAPDPVQRLGAGWLERMESAQRAELPKLEQNVLLGALASPDMQRGPPSVPQQVIFLASSLYALAALLVVRFGRVPGLFAGLSLALLFAAGAWGYLRPDDATLTRSRSVTLASGGLAQTLELRTLFSLPEGTRGLSVNAYPLEPTSWRASPGGVRFAMPRWSAVTLVLAPRLETATFYWEGDTLVNVGAAPLGDVFVIGLGQQPDISTDGRLDVQMCDSLPPPTYRPLLPHLPNGSALARSGGHIYVALPRTSADEVSGSASGAYTRIDKLVGMGTTGEEVRNGPAREVRGMGRTTKGGASHEAEAGL